MKAKWNKLMCKLFGHRVYEEVYAQRCDHFFGFNWPNSPNFYVVVRRTYCERCGHEEMEFMSQPMRRSQMLREGWFIWN